MRHITHFVVTTDSDARFALAAPPSPLNHEAPLPKHIVHWGCAGPWVLAWGTVAASRREAFQRKLYELDAKTVEQTKPIGRWFRKRPRP